MRNWRQSLLALTLLFSCGAVDQEAPQTAPRQGSTAASRFSKRATKLIGRISDDGQFLIADPDQDVWTVVNPDAVKAYVRQRVTLLVQTSAETSELRVLSATAEKDRPQTVAKSSDAAFRR